MKSSDKDLVASIRAWVDDWGAEVAAVDFAAGRRRFADDATAFGTKADVVHGAEQIAAQQWEHVWGTIDGFTFLTDQLVVHHDHDHPGAIAVAIVPWSSVGFHVDGTPFDRPGRATIVLRSVTATGDGPQWRAIHTHFSLALDTPSRSFGSPNR